MGHLALNVETFTTDTGHPLPPERLLITACHVVMNAGKLTTPEKLPTVVITLGRNGCKD